MTTNFRFMIDIEAPSIIKVTHRIAWLRCLGVYEPESKVLAKCKHLTTQQLSRSASVADGDVSASFITTVCSVSLKTLRFRRINSKFLTIIFETHLLLKN